MENKKQKIARLERELDLAKDEIDTLTKENDAIRLRIKMINELVEKQPDGCIPGAQCKVCMFARQFSRYSKFGDNYEMITCGRGTACKHFVEKDGWKEDPNADKSDN